MSDLGLYAGLSEALRRWADLIDDVLSGLKQGAVLPGRRSFEELKQLITDIARNDYVAVDFSDQRVANILALELGKQLDWGELAEQLNNPERCAQATRVLEFIAQRLAAEHASVVARMRWGRP